MNTLESCTVASPNNKSEVCAKFAIESTKEHFLLASITQPGKEYTFSFWAKSAEAGSINAGGKLFNTSDAWAKYVVTFTATEENFAINFPAKGTYYIYHAQLELGNKATDWTPSPVDVDEDVKGAAKTASNYIEFTEENGLQIGNRTKGIWEGFRTQITSTAFNILSAAGETLASYGAKLIELGKNAEDAVISMCGGKATMTTVEESDGLSKFKLSSDRLQFEAWDESEARNAFASIRAGVHREDGFGSIGSLTIQGFEAPALRLGVQRFSASGIMTAGISAEQVYKNDEISTQASIDGGYVDIEAEKELTLQGRSFGNADISNIGDGTVLGAIAALYEQLNS